jgi:hypothetical protein
MGTRALIHVRNEQKTICTIYRQYDGYYEGLGMDIYNILHKGHAKILNGYGDKSQVPTHFNGMGCLAAYLVGELKDEKIGNVYLYPANASDCGEEYTYTLWVAEDVLWIRAVDIYANGCIECPLSDYEDMIAGLKSQEEDVNQ